MQPNNIVVEFPKGRILFDATENKARVYMWATTCALEFDGIVRGATEEELNEEGWVTL